MFIAVQSESKTAAASTTKVVQNPRKQNLIIELEFSGPLIELEQTVKGLASPLKWNSSMFTYIQLPVVGRPWTPQLVATPRKQR